MKKLALILILCATSLVAFAQFGVDGMRTNAAWLNADQLIVGHVRAPIAGTNDAVASDGWILARSGNKMYWVNTNSLPGVGTVTSVGLSLPSVFDISGSPVTSVGTLTAVAHNANGFLLDTAGVLTWSFVGSSITALTPANISAGTIPANVSALSSQNSTNFWGTIFGTNFSFATPVAPSQTNMIVDFKLACYQSYNATNDINFLYATNGPGASAMKIRPGGSDRLLTFPTNWVWLDTNYFRLSGSFYVATLTNASTGSGPRVGWLSIVADGVDPTNVVARYKESP